MIVDNAEFPQKLWKGTIFVFVDCFFYSFWMEKSMYMLFKTRSPKISQTEGSSISRSKKRISHIENICCIPYCTQ